MKMYPKHVAENLTPNEAQLAGKLIGSGPWKFKDFSPQVSYELERNPDYFKEGLPYIDSMKHFVMADSGRVIAAFKAGLIRDVRSIR